jgi:transposase
MLRDGQPWQPQEIQQLINDEFGVEYHPVYLDEFLKDLGLSYAIPLTKRPSRPDNTEEILNERVGRAR